MIIKRSDLLVDVVPHSRVVIVAVRVDNVLIKKRYEGFSVRDAVQNFLADVNGDI